MRAETSETQSGETRPGRPTIGMLVDYAGSTAGPQHIVWTGVVEAARERDVNLICFPGAEIGFYLNEFAYQRNVLYDLVGRENVDGLIISATLGSHISLEEFSAFYSRYHPLPMVGTAMPSADIPTVLVDNEHGMRDVVAHLIEAHGFQHIAFVRGPEGSDEAEQRYHVYANTMAAHGLTVTPDLITPGNFMFDSGAAAANLLIKERKLRPGVSIEAVVAANDGMAIGLVRGLRSLGVRVPYDLAVVGFDDMDWASAFTPPLTTVRQPLYEQGKRAVDAVLALIAGEEIPHHIVLPTELIVRQSCGCLDQALEQAAAQIPPEAAAAQALPPTLAARRETILSDITRILGDTIAGRPTTTDLIASLVDTFAANLQGEAGSGVFLQVLEQALREIPAEGEALVAWHSVLSAIRLHTLPTLADERARLRAENLWQQARVMIGEAAQRAQTVQRLQTGIRVAMLPYTYQTLVTALDLGALADTIAQQLPQMGIHRCYISLYEDTEDPTAWSWFVVGHDQNGRIAPEVGGQRFATRKLVPDGLLPRDARHTLIAEPLYLKDERFGLALFEIGPTDGDVYLTLGLQISSALKSILLLQERKEAEEALRQRTHELEVQNAELDAFAHTVAHDLKNPLSTMILWSTMLQVSIQTMPPEEILEAMDRLTQAGHKMTNIIDELLLLASVRKAEDVEIVPLNMGNIVAEAQERLQDLIEERQAQIIAPDTWPAVVGHAPWVEEIWVNYISNAAKYGSRPDEGLPPHITLGFDEPINAHVRFWVRDKGTGLRPQEQARLFAPFTRLHQVRAEGHGLGLSIVQRIAEKLGGEVGVESVIGEGSTFYFTLPVAR